MRLTLDMHFKIDSRIFKATNSSGDLFQYNQYITINDA